MRLSLGESSYPERLTELPDPPRTLWARGSLALLDAPCVAIVGTRRATPYAERVARQLAVVLAGAGATVVSGQARGVDGVAHRGALYAGGGTCAVLGTGVDIVYPKAHRALQEEIAARGLLLSELAPGDAAHGGSFPRRNRIIAALCSVTIVVEAPHRSGALITAEHALALGRTVAVVPGPIDVPQAQGSNDLLRSGAHPILDMADALALLGLTAPVRASELADGSPERRLWDALVQGAADLDTLSTRARLPAHDAMAAAAELEMRGLVESTLTGELRRL